MQQKADQVIVVWECEWYAKRVEQPVLNFIKSRPLHQTFATRDSMTQAEMIAFIQSDRMKGLFEIDAYVPVSMAYKFQDINPFFYRMDVEWQMIGITMQEIMKRQKRQFEKRSSMLLNPPYCSKLLLPHQYIKYLLNQGIVIEKIHYAIEFPYAGYPFKRLAEEITKCRQEAAGNPEKEAEGLLQKLLGNSFYGTSITKRIQLYNKQFCMPQSGRAAVVYEVNSKFDSVGRKFV